jgi:peptide-methionine (S)-S-oxide reductase
MKCTLSFSLSLLLSTLAAGTAETKVMEPSTNHTETATLGGGCFWCTEALFQMLPGVKSVVSGFAGGTTENPSYKEVCTGKTGLETFWDAHDPTTLNRQGADTGTQYRSIILYNSEAQKIAAEKSKLAAQKHFRGPIVTEIVPLQKFWKAEDYHQDFYRNNPDYGYCRVVIRPKVEKFEKKLKAEH